jgi:hypothetical protein
MTEPKIEPHRITKPIQMLAVWFSALVLVDGAFLTAASQITKPDWVAPMLAIAAVTIVPVFLIAAFLMQTVFRAHLQDDQHYSKWLKSQAKTFVDFTPENVERPAAVTRAKVQDRKPNLANSPHVAESANDFERRRIKKYEEQRGLFLIHEWRPSSESEQVADIVVWLYQHGKGPLTETKVDRVEYQLGPKFFATPVIKRNANESFKLEISAYGPVLCLAKVYLTAEREPIELERYLDFEQAP